MAGLLLTGLALLLPELFGDYGVTWSRSQAARRGAFISDLVPFVFPIAHDGVSGEGVAAPNRALHIERHLCRKCIGRNGDRDPSQ